MNVDWGPTVCQAQGSNAPALEFRAEVGNKPEQQCL